MKSPATSACAWQGLHGFSGRGVLATEIGAIGLNATGLMPG